MKSKGRRLGIGNKLKEVLTRIEPQRRRGVKDLRCATKQVIMCFFNGYGAWAWIEFWAHPSLY